MISYERRRVLRVVFGTLTLVALVGVFVFLLDRTPGAARDLLARARPLPVLAGLAVYAFAYAARAARLNLVMPKEQRLSFGRAWSLSAATTFLLQVMPFRSGEAAGWLVVKRELSTTWARSGAIFTVVKLVDTAVLLMAGLSGAALLALRRSEPVLAGGTASIVLLGALALLALPAAGAALAERFSVRLSERPSLASLVGEIGHGLAVVRSRPLLYAGAVLGATAFVALHLVALKLVLIGLGTEVSIAGLAFASLVSVVTSAAPSPAGTFGPMESGFAAGLWLDGVPLATGALAATVLHALSTTVCGLVGLPFFLTSRRPVEGSDPTDGGPMPRAHARDEVSGGGPRPPQ